MSLIAALREEFAGAMRQLRVLVACECSGRVRDQFAARGWEAVSADLEPSETPCDTFTPETAHTRTSPLNWYIAHYDAPVHYQGDCRDLFNWNHPLNATRSEQERHIPLSGRRPPLWDLIIAHPPCDHLSYAGARWFAQKRADGRQGAAAKFFMEMTDAPSPLVVVENPHSIMQRLYRPPSQVVQPWMFGDPYVKGIHLWLKGLPELLPVYQESDFPALFRAATGGGSWRTDKAAQRSAMSAYEDSEGRKNRAKVRSRTFPGVAFHMAAQWGLYAEEYYKQWQPS